MASKAAVQRVPTRRPLQRVRARMAQGAALPALSHCALGQNGMACRVCLGRECCSQLAGTAEPISRGVDATFLLRSPSYPMCARSPNWRVVAPTSAPVSSKMTAPARLHTRLLACLASRRRAASRSAGSMACKRCGQSWDSGKQQETLPLAAATWRCQEPLASQLRGRV